MKQMTTDGGRILVVDDNQINRMMLTRALEEQGHQVATAENGRQALDLLRGDGGSSPSFDVVLLDIVMPETDGYQTLAQMKKEDALRHIPVIVISALDEIESVVRCIEMGAEDYLPKPFNPVLLRARIDASLEKKRLRDKEQIYLKGLERELEIGREIQASFLPEDLPQPPGWEIAARFQPAREVAGDFYDAFPLANNERTGLVIADVCDKGVGAALFMALFRSLLRALANQNFSDSNRAANLENTVMFTNNYIAHTHSQANMYATLFFGVLDTATGSLSYINAGHNPPIIIGGRRVKAQLVRTGPAVGILPDMNFAVKQIRLEPNDMLIAYTDGVTEARNPSGTFYTDERLLALLTAEPAISAAACLDRIQADVRAFISGAEQSDDVTLLAVQRVPSPKER